MDRNVNLLEQLDRQMQAIRGQLDPGMFVTALCAALAAAFLASLMYRFFYERRGTGSQVHRAFPLLAVSITTLFIGVQISIPLSLGLLGSLSIIRFRTPIKEPEEVGFIMLVIAASIAAATLNFQFIVYLYLVAFVALLIMRGGALCRWFSRDGVIVLSLPAEIAAEKAPAIEAFMRKRFRRIMLESVATRGGATTSQYIFSGLRGNAETLHADFSAVAPFTSVNIFLDRPGGLR